jgi:hypothetical protein
VAGCLQAAGEVGGGGFGVHAVRWELIGCGGRWKPRRRGRWRGRRLEFET